MDQEVYERMQIIYEHISRSDASSLIAEIDNIILNYDIDDRLRANLEYLKNNIDEVLSSQVSVINSSIHEGSSKRLLVTLLGQLNSDSFLSQQFQLTLSLACKTAIEIEEFDLADHLCKSIVSNNAIYRYINQENPAMNLRKEDGLIVFNQYSLIQMLGISTDYCWVDLAYLILYNFEDPILIEECRKFFVRMDDPAGLEEFEHFWGDLDQL